MMIVMHQRIEFPQVDILIISHIDPWIAVL